MHLYVKLLHVEYHAEMWLTHQGKYIVDLEKVKSYQNEKGMDYVHNEKNNVKALVFLE